MKSSLRLKRSTDFKRVRRLGKSYAHPLLVLVIYRNELSCSRIGVTAGRAVGGAVQRNRAKRMLRAAATPLAAQIQPGWDLVLIARQALSEVKTQAAQAALLQLLQRARIVSEA